METVIVCLIVAAIAGILCFIVEKSDKINIHIDRHRDAFLAGLTGGAVGFFASLILIMLHIL